MKSYLKYLAVFFLMQSCVVDHFEHTPFGVVNNSSKKIRLYFSNNGEVDTFYLKKNYFIIKPGDMKSPYKEYGDTLFNINNYVNNKKKLYLFIFDNEIIEKSNYLENWQLVKTMSFLERKIINISYLEPADTAMHQIIYDGNSNDQ